uniref:Uncharacterized protein n=1 Tax=Rhizophora mucronata TaxID=61149 RepID=A0A2P2NQ42_RHIMU
MKGSKKKNVQQLSREPKRGIKRKALQGERRRHSR